MTEVKNQRLYSPVFPGGHAALQRTAMPVLDSHPEAKIIRLQLRQNLVLKQLDPAHWRELGPLLEIADYPKGESLEHQGNARGATSSRGILNECTTPRDGSASLRRRERHCTSYPRGAANANTYSIRAAPSARRQAIDAALVSFSITTPQPRSIRVRDMK